MDDTWRNPKFRPCVVLESVFVVLWSMPGVVALGVALLNIITYAISRTCGVLENVFRVYARLAGIFVVDAATGCYALSSGWFFVSCRGSVHWA